METEPGSDPRSEARYRPGVARTYEGDGVRVDWEPALCIHVAACINALPQSFNPNARPWVQLEGVTAEQVGRAVEACPTGALTYSPRLEEFIPDECAAQVQPRRDGPLFLRGELEIVDLDGNVVRQATALALCRCGHSQNKPYCDLSHRAAGFKS